jgi:hypothetical protein
MTSFRCSAFLSLPFALFALTGCGGGAAASKIDQSSPKGLADSIFAAARDGDLASLAGIASADADGDAKRVAGVGAAEADMQKQFRDHFGKGKVNGDAKVDGDKAEVPILFGPDGTRPETLNMVRVNGVWQLQSF